MDYEVDFEKVLLVDFDNLRGTLGHWGQAPGINMRKNRGCTGIRRGEGD